MSPGDKEDKSVIWLSSELVQKPGFLETIYNALSTVRMMTAGDGQLDGRAIWR